MESASSHLTWGQTTLTLLWTAWNIARLVKVLSVDALQLLNCCSQGFDECSQFTYYSESDFCLAFETCVSFGAGTCTDCVSGDVDCELEVSSL